MTDALVYDAAERLFADLATSGVVNAAEAGTWPAEHWSAVTEAGFLDALGGATGGALEGLADAVDVLRAAGRHAVPLPIAETMLARWLAGRVGLVAPAGRSRWRWTGRKIIWSCVARVPAGVSRARLAAYRGLAMQAASWCPPAWWSRS
jgi:hypothetical protein